MRPLAFRSALALTLTGAALAVLPQTSAVAKPGVPCPLVFGHGNADAYEWVNNNQAIADAKAQRSAGVEGDLRFTASSTVAVMWHNITRNSMTKPGGGIYDSSSTSIANSTWTDIKDQKYGQGRYAGQGILSFYWWLNKVKAEGLYALVEVKTETDLAINDDDPFNGAMYQMSRSMQENGFTNVIFWSPNSNIVRKLREGVGKKYYAKTDTNKTTPATFTARSVQDDPRYFAAGTALNDVHFTGWANANTYGYWGEMTDVWSSDPTRGSKMFAEWIDRRRAAGECV
ncbi:hypothetical protein GCM10027589_10180 [Actinocorallia lasiicapitis]